MPNALFISLLLAVLLAAALTVWLISLGGPAVMAAVLPATLLASLALRARKK